MSPAVAAWSAHATLDGSCDTGNVWVVGSSKGDVTTVLRSVGVDVHRTWLKRHEALPPSLLGTNVESGGAVAFRFTEDGEWRLLPVKGRA